MRPPLIDGGRDRRQPRAPCRDVDDKKERFERLQGEFRDFPDDAGLTRLLEAFVSWRKAGQDRRGLSIDGGLAALERDGKRRIEQYQRSLNQT